MVSDTISSNHCPKNLYDILLDFFYLNHMCGQLIALSGLVSEIRYTVILISAHTTMPSITRNTIYVVKSVTQHLPTFSVYSVQTIDGVKQVHRQRMQVLPETVNRISPVKDSYVRGKSVICDVLGNNIFMSLRNQSCQVKLCLRCLWRLEMMMLRIMWQIREKMQKDKV